MSTTAERVIAAAVSQIGYHEGRSNGHWDNIEKYAAQVPGLGWANGQPWCDVFVAWCFTKAGAAHLIPVSASCAVSMTAWKRRGRWSEYPAVGAQVIFGGGDHTGIVQRYDAKYIWTIEGNAQPLDAKVLTPTGFKLMGDLRVGDELIEPSGQPSVVTGIYPKGVRPVYRLTLRDGSTTEACDQHLWKFAPGAAKSVVENTLRLKERLERGQRITLPRLTPVEYATVGDLRIHPYALGVLLGDAYINPKGLARLTSVDQFIVDELISLGLDVQQITVGDRVLNEFRVNGVARILREFGMAGKRSWEKVIPEQYLQAGSKDRLALLQGLMDTDGTIDALGRMEFTSSSPELANQVQHLVRSLGGRAAVNVKANVFYTSPGQLEPKRARPAYRVQNIRLADLVPFRLPRKADRWRQRTGGFGNNVVSVEYTRHAPVQCIAVSAPSHLYVTDDFIPTHNTNTNGSPEGDGVYSKVHARTDPWVTGYGLPEYPEGVDSADPKFARRARKRAPKRAPKPVRSMPSVDAQTAANIAAGNPIAKVKRPRVAARMRQIVARLRAGTEKK